MGEKRGESRIPLMARIDVLWTDREKTPRVAPAILEDKSENGFSLRLKESVPIGAHITMKRGSEQLSGVVAYCRREKSDYILGVKRS